jgi:transcription initiation factor IIE alpha subunit
MKRLFVKALKNKFDMDRDDAIALAKTVEGVFNGSEEIEDMTIDKHVRSLFYELHREKLLKLRREEYKEKGKQIRKYYWSFDNRVIREEAYRAPVKEAPYAIYQKIPRSAWLIQQSCNT